MSEPLTAEEITRLRHYAEKEPWQLPDRINTIQTLVRRLLATLDAARDLDAALEQQRNAINGDERTRSRGSTAMTAAGEGR